MVIVTFISTRNGKQWQQEFDTNNWAEILPHIKEDVDGMSAKLVRAGNQRFNMTLASDSVLPVVTGAYIVSFTQERMKGASEDVFDFTEDDVEEMSYRELNLTLKNIRDWAATNDKTIFDTIGNYTNITNSQRRDLLWKVLEMRTPAVVPANDEELIKLAETVVALENRLDTVERLLGLKL